MTQTHADASQEFSLANVLFGPHGAGLVGRWVGVGAERLQIDGKGATHGLQRRGGKHV